jgi:hypothetical protein
MGSRILSGQWKARCGDAPALDLEWLDLRVRRAAHEREDSDKSGQRNYDLVELKAAQHDRSLLVHKC